ncbi:hypothetical protein [Magnetospirillum aberrantis]|uniref:Uncharacterized protein n=1 Tax=Magnetospirillum aberrantis SpK TaxID=908842 RepID=A0A7C9QT73_9PROT|nr:hypothetical protein [Magnetospirillum aberrantis]NFV80020.1 hypothetical protein [Magnetospirillum aberrantis SpK]
MPEIATAVGSSRTVALADGRTPIPAAIRQTIPRARSHLSLPAHGTSPGRLPHGAAGELSSSEMVPPPVNDPSKETIVRLSREARIGHSGGGACISTGF